MYSSNMIHFLDDDGNITKAMPEEARELSSFLALIIDSYTHKYTDDPQPVRCFKKNCKGIINLSRSLLTDEIIWNCPACYVDGTISNWRGTPWENKGYPRVDDRVIDSEAIIWVQRLKSELTFPVDVTPGDLIGKDFPGPPPMAITRILDYREIDGVIVEVLSGNRGYIIPLSYFSIAHEDSPDFKLVDEFLDWWYRQDEEETDNNPAHEDSKLF